MNILFIHSDVWELKYNKKYVLYLNKKKLSSWKSLKQNII